MIGVIEGRCVVVGRRWLKSHLIAKAVMVVETKAGWHLIRCLEGRAKLEGRSACIEWVRGVGVGRIEQWTRAPGGLVGEKGRVDRGRHDVLAVQLGSDEAGESEGAVCGEAGGSGCFRRWKRSKKALRTKGGTRVLNINSLDGSG